MSARSVSIWFFVLLGSASTAYATQTLDYCDFDGGPPNPHSSAGFLSSYHSSDVRKLISKLKAEPEGNRRACWAWVLGWVGDQRAVDPLIAAIERPLDPLGSMEHDARHVAITALGYVLNRTGSERALTYLVGGLAPNVWRKRNVQGLAPFTRTSSEYDRLLSEYSFMALALSGDPRAGEALRALKSAPTPDQVLVGKDLDDMLASWLEVHQLVAERGLQGMFDYYQARRHAEQERYAEEARRKRAELYPGLPPN